MLVVLVNVRVRAEHVADFERETLLNATDSIQEPGIARFDVLKDPADATHFVLVEAYRDAEAPARHKETQHYRRWRDAVEPMMAEPRRSEKYASVFPSDADW